jgi:hypothetical protein
MPSFEQSEPDAVFLDSFPALLAFVQTSRSQGSTLQDGFANNLELKRPTKFSWSVVIV